MSVSCECGASIRVSPDHWDASVICPECSRLRTTTQEEETKVSPEPFALNVDDRHQHRELAAGELIGGKYRVVEKLGQGGMGEVYRVWYVGWNTDLAMKRPAPAMAHRRSSVKIIERETKMWNAIPLHPNVVSCYYMRRIDGLPCIFVEYVDGTTLEDLIASKRLYSSDHKKTLLRVFGIAIQMAWGVAHAHEHKVIHRDIKPANMLVAKGGLCKVTDFGLARAAPDQSGLDLSSSSSSYSTASGLTPAYCSPEQADGSEPSFASDIWSLGLVVLKLFTIRKTWTFGMTARDALDKFRKYGSRDDSSPKLPDGLYSLLRRCFEWEPEKRLADAGEFADSLVTCYEEATGERFPYRRPSRALNNAETHNNRAITSLELGRDRKAPEQWRKAIQINPLHTESVFNFAVFRWRNAEITDSDVLDTIASLRASQEREELVNYLYAQIHLERGDVETALEYLETLASKEKEHKEDNFFDSLSGVQSLLTASMPYTRSVESWIRYHRDTITAMCMDEASILVTGSNDNTIKVCSIERLGSQPDRQRGLNGSIVSLLLSADGSRIYVSCSDRTVRCLDRETLEELRKCDLGATVAVNLCMAEGGGELLAPCIDGMLRWLDLESLEPQKRDRLATRSVSQAVPVRKRPCLLIRTDDGVATLFDYRHPAESWRIPLENTFVTAVAIRPDAQYALVGTREGVVEMWNTEKRSVTQRFDGHRGPVHCLAFVGWGHHIVTGGGDKTIRMWSTRTGRCVYTYHARDIPSSLCIDDARGQAIVGLSNGELLKLHPNANVAFPCSPFLISRARSAAEVYGEERRLLERLRSADEAIASGNPAEGYSILCKLRRSRALKRRAEVLNRYFDLYKGMRKESLSDVWAAAPLQVHVATFSCDLHDGSTKAAYVGASDGTVSVWDLGRGVKLREASEHYGPIVSTTYLDAVGALATLDTVGQLIVWNAPRLEIRSRHTLSTEFDSDVVFSRDGRYFLTGGMSIRLYARGATVEQRLEIPFRDRVASFDWSDSGELVAAGGTTGLVELWYLGTRTTIYSKRLFGAPVTAIKWSPNGRHIAASAGAPWQIGADLGVWDLSSGERILHGTDMSAPATDLHFSADGRWLIAATTDGTIRIFDLARDACVKSFQLPGDSAGKIVAGRLLDRLYAPGATGALNGVVLDWSLNSKPPEEASIRKCLNEFLSWNESFEVTPQGISRVTDSASASARPDSGALRIPASLRDRAMAHLESHGLAVKAAEAFFEPRRRHGA